jgi:hypothetical protein
LIRTWLSNTARTLAILTVAGCTILIASSALGATGGGVRERTTYSAQVGVSHPLGSCSRNRSRHSHAGRHHRLHRGDHHRRLQHRTPHRRRGCLLRKHKAPKSGPTSSSPSPTSTSPTSTSPTSTTPTSTTPTSTTPGFSATAVDAGSVRLSWPDVPNAARVEVWRGSLLLDQFAWSSTATSYTDRGLWPSTPYAYSVRIFNSAASQVARFDGGASTPQRLGSFPRPFAATSFVNVPISPNPELESNSAAFVSKALVAYASNSNMSNSDSWGTPISYADLNTPQYVVDCTEYWCDVPVPPFPIPAYAQTSLGSDERLTVLDPSGMEYDMWDAHRTSSGWDAGALTALSSSGSGITCAPGERCGRANAAGFAQLAGVIRPEEIAQGHIDHALVITTPYTRAGYTACPANHNDGKFDDPDALAEGARIQLDPSLNVDSLAISNLNKIIARALQVYGAYVVDTGGTVAIRAESNRGRGYDAWSKVGVASTSPNISALPWSRMRVLKMTKCG